jgi:hypothetical protein
LVYNVLTERERKHEPVDDSVLSSIRAMLKGQYRVT